ncbi:hypothetical protein [Microlunatus parietis]|uniref:Uncharacterized protein n=1 Tax=Microlunatus parietis TaxID=682979 RepID=A0A7Y9L9D2_9ACTN|nr:hypothetical protein [Microlunatus parietis]NYE69452.1 hypothetical protein [Microlunatus parietis]
MIGADDPERAVLLQAVLVATRDPWNAAESLPNKRISVAEAQKTSARLHAELAAAVGPAAVLTRLDRARELAELAAATGRDEDAAWASLYRLEAHYQRGRRLEINAELMRLAATVRRLRTPVWDSRVAPGSRLRSGTLPIVAGLADLVVRGELEAQRGGDDQQQAGDDGQVVAHHPLFGTDRRPDHDADDQQAEAHPEQHPGGCLHHDRRPQAASSVRWTSGGTSSEK